MGVTDISHLSIPDLVTEYAAGASASALARRHGVSIWSIITRLRKAGVEIRRDMHERHSAHLLPEQFGVFRSLVDGLLLGDASIDPQGFLRMEQAPLRREWLDHVGRRFAELGISHKIISRGPKISTLEGRIIRSNGSFTIYTPILNEFRAERERWYAGNSKSVPQDLRLDALCAAMWFAGDGAGSPNGFVMLHTEGFTMADVDSLVAGLASVDVIARRMKSRLPSQWKVAITSRTETVKFRDLVFPHLPECCRYKLRYVRGPKDSNGHAGFTDDQVRDIRARVRLGESKVSVAARHGVTSNAIRMIVSGRSYRRVPDEVPVFADLPATPVSPSDAVPQDQRPPLS